MGGEQLTQAVEALRRVEELLTNLQPHIPQACHPGREKFIDNYVQPALEILRAALSAPNPPQPAEPPKPMTDADMRFAVTSVHGHITSRKDFEAGIRFAEGWHGIVEGATPPQPRAEEGETTGARRTVEWPLQPMMSVETFQGGRPDAETAPAGGEMEPAPTLETAYADGRADEREVCMRLLNWAYSKLMHVSFTKQEDALAMDEIKLMAMGGQ